MPRRALGALDGALACTRRRAHAGVLRLARLPAAAGAVAWLDGAKRLQGFAAHVAC
jgi:hypothetical protein